MSCSAAPHAVAKFIPSKAMSALEICFARSNARRARWSKPRLEVASSSIGAMAANVDTSGREMDGVAAISETTFRSSRSMSRTVWSVPCKTVCGKCALVTTLSTASPTHLATKSDATCEWLCPGVTKSIFRGPNWIAAERFTNAKIERTKLRAAARASRARATTKRADACWNMCVTSLCARLGPVVNCDVGLWPCLRP